VGDGQLGSSDVQVHDLVPPEDVQRDGVGLVVDDDPDDPVLGPEVGRALLIGLHEGRIGEGRDSVLPGPAIEDL
jgi:hypothetical protein